MIRYAPAEAVLAPKARKSEVVTPAIEIASSVALKEETAGIAVKPAAEPLALSGEAAPKTRKPRKAAPAGKRSPATKHPETESSALLLDLQG